MRSSGLRNALRYPLQAYAAIRCSPHKSPPSKGPFRCRPCLRSSRPARGAGPKRGSNMLRGSMVAIIHPRQRRAGTRGHTSAVPASWTRRLESWPALSETELIPHHKLTGAKQLAINTIQSLGTRWGEERGEEHRPVDGRSLMTGLPRGGASGRPGCSTKPTHILRLDLGVCALRMRGLRETMREKWPTSPSSPSDNTNESRGIRTRVQ